MIRFKTGGWTSGSFELFHADGDDFVSFILTPDNYASDVLGTLVEWILGGARPWAGSISTAVLSTRVQGDRLIFRLEFTGSDTEFLFAGLDAAQTIGPVGLEAAALVFGPSVAGGDIGCDTATANWSRHNSDEGIRGRAGSWRMEHPAFVFRRPGVEAVLSVGQAHAAGLALQAATDPREADIFDDGSATWRRAKVGEVVLETVDDDWTQFTLRLQVLGEV